MIQNKSHFSANMEFLLGQAVVKMKKKKKWKKSD